MVCNSIDTGNIAVNISVLNCNHQSFVVDELLSNCDARNSSVDDESNSNCDTCLIENEATMLDGMNYILYPFILSTMTYTSGILS